MEWFWNTVVVWLTWNVFMPLVWIFTILLSVVVAILIYHVIKAIKDWYHTVIADD